MKGLIFTYLLTYGGAIASLVNPFIGLLIYVCFAIIKPESLWYWAVPAGNYSRIVAVALLVGWILRGRGSWKFGAARGVVIAFGCFQLWLVVASFSALNQEQAWAFTEAMFKVLVPFVVGLTLIDSTAKLRQLAWVVMLSNAYLAYEFNLSYYEGFNRLVNVGFASMDDKSVAVSMVLCAALALSLGLRAHSLPLKGVAFVSAILMLHVPLFTMSRGGMMALIVTGGVVFVLMPKRALHFAAFALVVALGMRLAGAEVREKFSTAFVEADDRDASAQTRLDHWDRCWETMLAHPLTGVGPRSWGTWVQVQYDWPTAQEAHNTWMQAGAELGFPGVIALASVFVVVCLRVWPLARGRTVARTTFEAEYARMVIASVSGFAVASQFITLYGIEAPYYVVLIGAGLLKLQHLGVKDSDTASEKPPLGADSQAAAPSVLSHPIRPSARVMTAPGPRD